MQKELYIELLVEKQAAWLASGSIMEEALLAKDYERFFVELDTREQIVIAYQDLLRRLSTTWQNFAAEFQVSGILPFLLQHHVRLSLSQKSVDNLQILKEKFVVLRQIEEKIECLTQDLPTEIEGKLKQAQGRRSMVRAYDKQKLQLAEQYARFGNRF